VEITWVVEGGRPPHPPPYSAALGFPLRSKAAAHVERAKRTSYCEFLKKDFIMTCTMVCFWTVPEQPPSHKKMRLAETATVSN